MKHVKLENSSDPFFERAWELYKDSFPLHMRRSREKQLKIMKHPLYSFDVIVLDQEFIGFLFWWDFDNCRFIEYFAISSNQRNTGLGKKVLENFIENEKKPFILEVELPNTEIDSRRIKFYQRVGFKLNKYQYILPPLNEGDQEMEFLLMTYPEIFSTEEVEAFINICHPIILGAY